MTSRAGNDVDLGPWAAYAVGHHVYSLAAWHSDSWAMLRKSGTILDLGYENGAPHELRELGEALRILSLQGRLDAAVLNDFRVLLERFVAVSKEMFENGESELFNSEYCEDEPDPCASVLTLMASCTGEIITGPEDLLLWERCGAAIGESQVPPDCLVSSWRWKGYRGYYDALVDAFHELIQTDEYPFLTELEKRLPGLDPQPALEAGVRDPAFDEVQRHRLAALDDDLRQALRRQAPPEVWLDFDKDRLIFFGYRYYVGRLPTGEKAQDYKVRLPETEAAFLWVLADRVGEEVSRTTIREEGAIEPEEERLQETASRLRRKLRPAIKAYYAKRGRMLPEHADWCFIVGRDGDRPSSYGPYILDLPPHRIRVSPERPSWVGPRADP